MKLTVLLLTIAIFQAKASAVAQTVSFTGKNISLQQVFQTIEKQTGYVLFSNSKMLKHTRPVTLSVRDMPLRILLDSILKIQPVDYFIRDKTIILSEKTTSQKIGSPLDTESPELMPAPQPVSGRVVDSLGNPVQAASVRLNPGKIGVVTQANGSFLIPEVDPGSYTLEISLVGHLTITRKIKVEENKPLVLGPFVLQINPESLEEFSVVSTGYQRLPKERVTGSFVQVNEQLINRRVSTNLLERLEDVASGVLFNKGSGSQVEPITIRGRSTIFANTDPLIIVDNFPYDGSLENINPNDVESMTILRDAAAASIWGARAGNGVIVITTKKGKYNSKVDISYNTNLTVGARPDQYYVPQMNIGEFIEIEKVLFNRGFYRSAELSTAKTKLSPVVEILIRERDGLLTTAEANQLIDGYKTHDVRRDLEQYYYRNSVNQQHSLNVRGGSTIHQYAVSAGLDRNLSNQVGSYMNRITLSAQNTWSLLKNKLKLSAGMYLPKNKNYSDTKRPQTEPYDRLADEAGNPLPIAQNYSERYINSIANDGLLDWTYVPLAERGLETTDNRSLDLRLNASAGYQLLPGLKAEVLYQYWQNDGRNREYSPVNSYYTRSYINRYTQVNPDGSLWKPVPEGDILALGSNNAYSHSIRGQVNYFKEFGEHSISALAGYEAKDNQGESASVTYFGYDNELALSQPVDFTTRFRMYFNPGSQTAISPGTSHTGTVDRFISYYGNMAYTYKRRYFVTLSARKDQSNLFGVEANMRGVPLWSAGLGWNISKEPFYRADWLSLLKLRATYGYSGNVDKSLSAYTTAFYSITPSYELIPGLLNGGVVNPPNPALRWEKIQSVNLGLDFELRNRVVSGTIEWYIKKGMDLISSMPVAASTGSTRFTGNFASTLTNGIDITLTTINLSGRFGWNTRFLYSGVNEKILSYETRASASNYMSTSVSGSRSASIYPMEGRPLFAVYSYGWAGLDPQTGDPLGYLDHEPSTDYNAILNAATPDNIVYHGPVRPSHFGAMRNDFSWKGFSLSVNISFRMGNYFRRRSVDYYWLLRGRIQHGDYANRWQEPGDETRTNIPSIPPYTSGTLLNVRRNNFYTASSALVEKGDHIRLQDIRLAYQLTNSRMKRLPVKRIELYGYANNLGIIWKATDLDIDPYSISSRPVRTVSIGCRVDF